MTWMCATRALKNHRFVRASVPKTFPHDALHELDALSPQTWSALAGGANPHELIRHPELAKFLLSHPLPRARKTATGPLFNGTLVFVQFIFDKLTRTGLKIQDSDMNAIIAYADKAVVPIQQYASQYGFCSVSVAPAFIPFSVRVDTDTFTDGELQKWVDKIVGDNQLKGVCLVLPFNTSFPFPALLESQDLGYHSRTSQGHPYCACSVSGGNLTVRDPSGLYAPTVSHEIAEMVVDPATDGANPEVCDACAGNCKNVHFVGFDAQGQYLGGVKTDQTYPNIDFYIASIVQPGAIDPQSPNSCALPTLDSFGVCVYPPPQSWPDQGALTRVTEVRVDGIVALAGHYSAADQRQVVFAGTSHHRVHEIFWQLGQLGIEGEDDLPVSFAANIEALGSLYNSDQQRHVVVVGTIAGKVHEIFWKSDTVGIEGHDDLPVNFAPGSIVAVSGLYDPDQQRHIVVVGTYAGKVHEIFWKADTVGIEGHDDLPVQFDEGSIVSVAAFYNGDQRRYVVIVATKHGTLHEIFWKTDTVGVEGHDDLPVTFEPGSLVSIAGFYDPIDQRHVVIAGTKDGSVHQLYWKAYTVGIESHNIITRITGASLIGLAAFRSDADGIEHIVAALSDGTLRELSTAPIVP